MLTQSVLVLNQNYEAISICSDRKAVVLIFLKKAQMVETYGINIHAVTIEIPYPSVIRLNRYVQKPYQKVSLSRSNIIKRDKHTCQYCGKNHQPMTIDHVIPKSVGGKDTWENLVCACIRWAARWSRSATVSGAGAWRSILKCWCVRCGRVFR